MISPEKRGMGRSPGFYPRREAESPNLALPKARLAIKPRAAKPAANRNTSPSAPLNDSRSVCHLSSGNSYILSGASKPIKPSPFFKVIAVHFAAASRAVRNGASSTRILES